MKSYFARLHTNFTHVYQTLSLILCAKVWVMHGFQSSQTNFGSASSSQSPQTRFRPFPGAGTADPSPRHDRLAPTQKHIVYIFIIIIFTCRTINVFYLLADCKVHKQFPWDQLSRPCHQSHICGERPSQWPRTELNDKIEVIRTFQENSQGKVCGLFTGLFRQVLVYL